MTQRIPATTEYSATTKPMTSTASGGKQSPGHGHDGGTVTAPIVVINNPCYSSGSISTTAALQTDPNKKL